MPYLPPQKRDHEQVTVGQAECSPGEMHSNRADFRGPGPNP